MGTWIHGLRRLAKNHDFTALAVLTLALGIGANAAVCSIFDVVLLTRLPAFEYLRNQNGVLSENCTTPEWFAVSIDAAAELIRRQIVSGGYSSSLRVTAALGPTLTAKGGKIPREFPQSKRRKPGTWQQKTRNNKRNEFMKQKGVQ